MDEDKPPKRKSRPRERYPDFEPLDQVSTPVEPPLQSRAVASVNDPNESLYEQLLRHHRDNNLDDSDNIDTTSIRSEDDRKLPASISPQANRRPVSNALSRNHVSPVAASHLISKDFVGEEMSLSRRRLMRNDAVVDAPNIHTHTMKASREQSSFYKAAMEAAGGDRSHKVPMNDVETDELFARSLAEILHAPPPVSALDEELARAFQAAQETLTPRETEEQDVALALQLMQQEQQELLKQQQEQRDKQRLYQYQQQQQQHANTISDEALALRLSKEVALGRDHDSDELLARQLSSYEKEAFRTTEPAKMVPEQLQILERIQQDKERQLIERAIMESSLHEIPGFMEPGDVGVRLPVAGRGGDEDFRRSQELALRDWSTGHDRPYGSSSQIGNSGVTDAPFSRPSTESLRSDIPSNTQRNRGMHVGFIPGRVDSADAYWRETSLHPRPGGVLPSTRSPLPSTLPLPQMLQSGSRTRSFDPSRRSSLPLTPAPNFPNNAGRVQVSTPTRSMQNVSRPGPSAELLRRGNEETRNAIATHRAHVVVCQGCRNRLLAPENYSLVLCPTCNTISPGLLVDGDSSIGPGGVGLSFNR